MSFDETGDGSVEVDGEATEYREVRATVHLPGLQPGETALVPMDRPYIRECLACGHLVLTGR